MFSLLPTILRNALLHLKCFLLFWYMIKLLKSSRDHYLSECSSQIDLICLTICFFFCMRKYRWENIKAIKETLTRVAATITDDDDSYFWFLYQSVSTSIRSLFFMIDSHNNVQSKRREANENMKCNVWNREKWR